MEDFLRVIDEITPHVNPNRVLVIFTGGEALLRNDLEQCGLELYRRGFPWGIVTNGLFLTQERLDSLMAAGMHTATVSMDGLLTEHNWLRRNPRSFRKALYAIRMMAHEPDLVWDVVSCIHYRNLFDLEQFRDFLWDNGCRRWRIFTIFPVGRGAELEDLALTDSQFTYIFNFIRRCRKERHLDVSYGCEGFLGNYEAEVRDSFYECSAGISTASILIDGSISGCPSIRSNYKQGNIYKDNFMDVWNNRFQPYRDRSWARQGECADCKLFRYCEGGGMHLHDDDGKLLFCHYNKLL